MPRSRCQPYKIMMIEGVRLMLEAYSIIIITIIATLTMAKAFVE